MAVKLGVGNGLTPAWASETGGRLISRSLAGPGRGVPAVTLRWERPSPPRDDRLEVLPWNGRVLVAHPANISNICSMYPLDSVSPVPAATFYRRARLAAP